jgi:hypothetical protein
MTLHAPRFCNSDEGESSAKSIYGLNQSPRCMAKWWFVKQRERFNDIIEECLVGKKRDGHE